MRVTLPEEVRMRGDDRQQAAMWSHISPEQRVPPDHPLRPIRAMVEGVLRELSPRFEALYAKRGRPSIAPEKLLRALVLQLLYSVRSERLLMEQLDYNLLFRWFVGLNMDDPIWDATVFTKNRPRRLDGDIAQAFFEQVLAQARAQRLLGDEHFTVDGTLIEAWAGLKRFKKPGGPRTPPEDPGKPTVNFHGERRSNATHASTTDPEARLIRKGNQHEAKLGYLGHALMDNRQGLVVQACVTPATGTAEWEAALAVVDRVPAGATLGADRGYDTRAFVAQVRARGLTPHVAQNTSRRRSAIDGRTTRHAGYWLSQRRRKRVEEVFGWLKTVALFRKTRHRGVARVGWLFVFATALYNLVRLRNLGRRCHDAAAMAPPGPTEPMAGPPGPR
jgi:transposase